MLKHTKSYNHTTTLLRPYHKQPHAKPSPLAHPVHEGRCVFRAIAAKGAFNLSLSARLLLPRSSLASRCARVSLVTLGRLPIIVTDSLSNVSATLDATSSVAFAASSSVAPCWPRTTGVAAGPVLVHPSGPLINSPVSFSPPPLGFSSSSLMIARISFVILFLSPGSSLPLLVVVYFSGFTVLSL